MHHPKTDVRAKSPNRLPKAPARRTGATVLLLLLAACASNAIDDLSAAAVHVEATPCGRATNGSGFAVDGGLVLTNAHLVAGSSGDVRVRTADDMAMPATVVGFDIARDLALLRVDGLEADPVRFAEAPDGSAALIMTRPVDSGLQTLEAVVVRQFNATGDDIYGEGNVRRRAIELRVDVPTGVSGAGVYSSDGELIGVVFAESTRKDDTAYAVAANEVEEFLVEGDSISAADTQRCRDP